MRRIRRYGPVVAKSKSQSQEECFPLTDREWVKDRVYGRLAHLVEHNPCKVGVNGSSPLSSTIKEKKNDSQI